MAQKGGGKMAPEVGQKERDKMAQEAEPEIKKPRKKSLKLWESFCL